MKAYFKFLFVALLLAPLPAFAEWEGTWSLDESAGCESAQYDTFVVMEDHEGRMRGWTSRRDFGISWHHFVLESQGAESLQGTTIPSSPVQGDFSATFNGDADSATFDGSVLDPVCPAASTFSARRDLPDGAIQDFTPAGDAATVQDFVGSWSFVHGRDPVTLNLVALRDGRLVGSVQSRFGSSVARFDAARLSGQKLTLWSTRNDDTLLKWSLEFGTSNGQVALSGRALSSLGRYVRLHGVRTANP
jgi:hypothetical protein